MKEDKRTGKDINQSRSTIELRNTITDGANLNEAMLGENDDKYKVNGATDEEIELCKEICRRERGHCT